MKISTTGVLAVEGPKFLGPQERVRLKNAGPRFEIEEFELRLLNIS